MRYWSPLRKTSKKLRVWVFISYPKISELNGGVRMYIYIYTSIHMYIHWLLQIVKWNSYSFPTAILLILSGFSILPGFPPGISRAAPRPTPLILRSHELAGPCGSCPTLASRISCQLPPPLSPVNIISQNLLFGTSDNSHIWVLKHTIIGVGHEFFQDAASIVSVAPLCTGPCLSMSSFRTLLGREFSHSLPWTPNPSTRYIVCFLLICGDLGPTWASVDS